jgi:hypothetical protein
MRVHIYQSTRHHTVGERDLGTETLVRLAKYVEALLERRDK